MKIILTAIAILLTINVFSQAGKNTSTKRTKPNTKKVANTYKSKTDTTSLRKVEPRQTITEKYINGDRTQTSSTTNNATNSPFVGGITANTNASTTFDTSNKRQSTTNTPASSAATNVPGGNDTAFNINSINQNGVTTTSGAVDKSGQSQFGQTNWRENTIGESQWTIPPPITSSFNREFPGANNASWSRNARDTSLYMARYRSEAGWVMSTYNASGQRMDIRTEMPLMQTPRPVTVFSAKQPPAFQVTTVYRLQLQGRPDIYEIQTKDGRTFYINNDGMEVKY